MGFNFKGFATGLAESGSDYLDDRATTKKENTAAKRDLIFNTTQGMYNNASNLKAENDKLIKEDKKYLSTILSIDPQISKDNQNKLLSLGVDDRKKAEDEYYFRKASDPTVTFGDFMSLVNDPEDIGNEDLMQASLAKATKPVPKVASAFYDKTGLIKDETVDKIYDSAVSALTSIHGFSAAKAQQIISEGVYNVQHPPIKIDWSQNLEIAENAAEDRIYTESLQSANLQDAALGITNKQIEATTKAIESVRGLWQSNYMIPVLDSGEEVKNPDGSTKMQAMPSIMAGTRSGLEQEFRNSPEYKQLAIDSMTPHIVALVENPAKSKQSSLNYLNTAFPGMYGGTYDISTASPEKVKNDIDPAKVYHIQNVDRNGGPPKGYIYLGEQILAAMGTTPKVAPTVAGTSDSAVYTDENPITSAVTAAQDDIATAEQNLATAKETGADSQTIEMLEDNIASSEDELDRQKRKARYSDARDIRMAQDKAAKPVFTATASDHRTNAESLDIAIDEGDEDKAQLIADNLDYLLSRDGLSTDQRNKLGKVRGDALRAVKDIPELRERTELYDTRTAPLESLRARSLKAREAGASREEVIAIIKDINAYVKTATNDEQLMELDGLKAGLNTLL